jgi:ABC-2 type transport system permease protein
VIRLLRSAMWYQVVFFRHHPDRLLPLVNVPLLTAAFLTIIEYFHRFELAGYAVVGSGVIGIWLAALYVSGDIIEADRINGVLEAATATPAPLPLVVVARNAVIATVGFLGLVESVLVAELFFRVPITIRHPALFAVTLVITWVAMVGTGTMISGLFVLARAVRTLQNSLSYPVYLLSGALVPVALLPPWIQPLSRVIFLSWVFDLLRDCLRPDVPAMAVARLGVITALGGAGFVVGYLLISRILNRLRRLGTIGYQ